MPAINFQTWTAKLIELAAKAQTIRKRRKHPIRVGDTLKLYTGQRTKECRLIKETVCSGTREIVITATGITLRWPGNVQHIMTKTGLNEYALRDGFGSWDAMIHWFNNQYGLPFAGVEISWTEEPDETD